MWDSGTNCQNVGQMWDKIAKCGKCGNVGRLYGLLIFPPGEEYQAHQVIKKYI